MEPCDRPYTTRGKWIAAATLALAFLILSSPYAYNLTNSLTQMLGLTIADSSGCPNLQGLAGHALIFTLVVRGLIQAMENKCERQYASKDKWIVSFIAGILFMIVGSPYLYEAVDSITSELGYSTIKWTGCPNVSGLLIHSLVYGLAARALMR